MKKKYSSEEIGERTIITTDKEKGSLLQEALSNGYRTFEIPSSPNKVFNSFICLSLLYSTY